MDRYELVHTQRLGTPVNLIVRGSLLISCLSSPIPSCFAEDASPSQSSEQDRVAEALEITTAAAKRYQFELATSPRANSFFIHSRSCGGRIPSRVRSTGTFMYGRSTADRFVIGSIHQWYSPLTHGSHEFQSLSVEPLLGRREEATVWSTKKPGIAPHPVPRQPAVAESKSTRTRQLRELSRRFQVRKDRSPGCLARVAAASPAALPIRQ